MPAPSVRSPPWSGLTAASGQSGGVPSRPVACRAVTDDLSPTDDVPDDPTGPSLDPPRSPNFLEALKLSWGGSRTARPASGTDAQARAVNYIDRRERIIATVLGVVQVIGGIWAYTAVRSIVVKATRHPKVTVHQAHLDTLHWHHIAIYYLVVNVILGFGILGSVLAKRRALVGVMVLLGGFAFLTYGGGLVGFIYLGVGGWLIFRGRKKQATAAPAPTSRKRPAATSGAAPAPAPARKPPAASRRYTPPRDRPVPAKRKDKSEEPKPSRFPSWARR